ncbi:hypothetical protein H920_18521 [Fukomys damarensis]|uniref:Uncharacterized protein n=1 Tax=Fukomys damarensis TaxID=885580 RepID=A0A091CPS8_FUKDA|nr:hypothetical protein H920_18521 [Fukomys damarensis]
MPFGVSRCRYTDFLSVPAPGPPLRERTAHRGQGTAGHRADPRFPKRRPGQGPAPHRVGRALVLSITGSGEPSNQARPWAEGAGFRTSRDFPPQPLSSGLSSRRSLYPGCWQYPSSCHWRRCTLLERGQGTAEAGDGE